jgi:hypothetical protein
VALLARGVFDHARVERSTSDIPCRALRKISGASSRASQGTRIASACCSSKDNRLSQPRTPSIDKCSPRSLSRFSLEWEPATDLAVLPPTIRLPTLFRHPRCSRTEWLDPKSDPRALRSWALGTDVACRLLQPVRSASTPLNRPNLAHRELSRLRSQLGESSPFGFPIHLRVALSSPPFGGFESSLRGRANRDFTGQGLARARGPAQRLTTRSLVRRASPQPDRLRHLPSQSRDNLQLES